MTSDEPPQPPLPETAADDAKRRLAIFGLVGGFMGILVLIVAIGWITDGGGDDVAERLPAAALTTLDGEPFELSDIGGTPTVINFFASWCGPCRVELPDFEQVHRATEGTVDFIGINTRETDPEAARELLEQTGVSYTVLLGDDGSVYQSVTDLGVMPTTVFVNADGTVADIHAGPLTADDLASRVEKLSSR